jgi:hypothetical protein
VRGAEISRAAGDPNGPGALAGRCANGLITWTAPFSMLFARSIFAVFAQGAIVLLSGTFLSIAAWRSVGRWLPVYGTLIDLGCLLLLRRLARIERISLSDLAGFGTVTVARDLLLELALIPPSLLLIVGGIYASSLVVYGNFSAPQIFSPLPLPAALYATFVFPLIWGVTEQTTYNGYVLPRLEVVSGSRLVAVAGVALLWSAQHAVMPLSFDPGFMLYRALAPLPFSTFAAFIYLRLRRIAPLAIAHGLMDGGAAFAGTLWPALH